MGGDGPYLNLNSLVTDQKDLRFERQERQDLELGLGLGLGLVFDVSKETEFWIWILMKLGKITCFRGCL